MVALSLVMIHVVARVTRRLLGDHSVADGGWFRPVISAHGSARKCAGMKLRVAKAVLGDTSMAGVGITPPKVLWRRNQRRRS